MNKPSYPPRIQTLITHVILMVLFISPLCAEVQIMVFPQVQQIAAPNGLEFKTGPTRGSRATQTISEATVFRGKAYLDTPEGRFFLSEKSYEKLLRGEPAYWAYIFGVSGGGKVMPQDGRADADLPPPGPSLRSGTMENQWAYEFLAKPEADSKISRFSTSKGRRVLLANDEWIVTSTFTSLGMGRGKCELAFYDATTLLLEARVSVPNDVLHIDWNSRRRQFVAITTCGEGDTFWIKYPDHCAQALVVMDLTARKLEAARLWKDSGNSNFDWDAACTPLWTQGGIDVPYAPDNDKTVPLGRIQFRAREFADLKVTYFKQPAESSRLRLSGAQPETAGLAYERMVVAKNTHPYEDGASPLLQASANAVTAGDLRGIHLVRPTAARGILDLNLSTLKSYYHKVPDSPVRQAGIFTDGVVRFLTPRGLWMIAPDRTTTLKIQETGGTDKARKIEFSDDAAYLAGLAGDGRAKLEINRVDSSGLVHAERVALPDGIISLERPDFTLNVGRKSVAVIEGDFTTKRLWKEYSWDNGLLASRPFEDHTGKGMASSDHFFGSAPVAMRLISGLTEASTGGRAFTVVLMDTQTKREIVIGEGSQRGAQPLAAVKEGPNSVLVLSSGWMAAQLERVDLRSDNVSKITNWTWDSNDGAPFFEKSGNWLFIPKKEGLQLFQPFGKQPSTKLADIHFDGDGGYAIVMPDGIYAGSPGCERLLRLHTASGAVEAGALAQWRNRPAEVLKTLNGDSAQVDLLGRVTERWISRHGFDPNAAEPPATALPRIQITQRPGLWASSNELVLPVEVRAGSNPVREVMVRANGAAVFRMPAEDLPAGSSGAVSLSAKIKLAQGLNWIEVTAMDAKGRPGNTERFRTILKTPPAEVKRYVIALGVSKYAREELNLDFAAKDARELLEVLREASGSRAAETLLLTDAEVEPQALQTIAAFLAKSAESDEVILFCAGHGTLDEKLDYVFASHRFDPEKPGQTGIKLDDLVSVITACPARKRLMLLDTCQAGLVGEAEESLLAKNAGNLAPGVRSIRLRGLKVPDPARQATPDARRFVEELYLLPGLIRGTNIIGASGGAQFAYEMDQLRNGVFTAAAIEALQSMKADADKDGRVMVSELKDYLARRVPELTGNAQRPSVVAFEPDQDFELIKK